MEGEERYSSGTISTDYTYTGQYSNTDDFGLMYYKARWYDPVLGRFAQADSIVPGAGNPLAWDRYAYVMNNPVINTDPSGHTGKCIWCMFYTYVYQPFMQNIGRTYVYPENVNKEANNLGELMTLAFYQEPDATITGEALFDISTDKPLLDRQEKFTSDIQSDPRYKISDYSGEIDTFSNTFGEMGNSNMLEDATHSQTWTVRAANVSASYSVAIDGTITYNYSLSDTLDLVPDWEHRTGFSGFMYNVITTPAGAIWHGSLLANKIDTSATWTTIVRPKRWEEKE